MPTLMIQLAHDTPNLNTASDDVRDARLQALHDILKAHQATLSAPLGDAGGMQHLHCALGVAEHRLPALQAALLSLEGVEAAYIKPDDALP
jgi:hypothetical protein